MWALIASGSRRKRTAKVTRKRHYKKRKSRYKNIKLTRAERRAKAWIAWHESRNHWHVSNGNCYGKYQLSYSYLHGDYSPRNQSDVADRYVHFRYGNWLKAKQFWQYHYWY